MSRWGGKQIVVPLETSKESTNRPTVARSLGTMGKWGKMGFTSTRTYTMSALPAAVAAAAAAVAAASPQESPASHKDDDQSSSADPPKPRKFFKSRNTTPPEVIAQIIQQIPRTPASPTRDSSATGGTMPSFLGTPIREPIKMKIPKTNSAERKKKSPKKSSKKSSTTTTNSDGSALDDSINEGHTDVDKPRPEPKSTKKKKAEKELKPEAPPSRILGRARKAVNYCEDDYDDRMPTPIKDIVVPKQKKADKVISVQETPPPTPAHKVDDVYASCDTPEPVLPPPAVPSQQQQQTHGTILHQTQTIVNSAASKTPEHPPIVLRISKGTSRLVSTDSEEQQPNASSSTPPSEPTTSAATTLLTETPQTSLSLSIGKSSRQASVEDSITPAAIVTTPKIIVKPLKPPPSPSHHHHLSASGLGTHLEEQEEEEESEEEEGEEEEEEEEDEPEPEPEPPEINYCTVKISPDKPPKERLKLIIKTDVIRNALAAAAAAAAKAKAKKELLESSGNAGRSGKEGKTKKKKRKHLKHSAVEQLAPQQGCSTNEFKIPSPHPASIHEHQQLHTTPTTHHPPTPLLPAAAPSNSNARTIVSPGALSERDFDSQSSVLGSISSKGNSTPLDIQPPPEESCVLHSRGSSVITSDLETSQHSSLVAPPSDIELRLESMMMDGESSQQQRTSATFVEAEPLQEDILAVLRGDETTAAMDVAMQETQPQPPSQHLVKENGLEQEANENIPADTEVADGDASVATPAVATTAKRTRGRPKANYAEPPEDIDTPPAQTPRTRGRKPAAVLQPSALVADETPATNKRATRRGKKVVDEPMLIDDTSPAAQQTTPAIMEESSPNKSEEENNPVLAPVVTTRRGRASRNANNNNNNLNNNNINKIAINLTAKANNHQESVANHKLSPCESATPTTTSVVNPPVTQKSYGRKRKNQQTTQVLQPSSQEDNEEYTQPPPAKQLNLDLPTTDNIDTQIAPIQPFNENRLTPSLDIQDNNSLDSCSLPRPPSSLGGGDQPSLSPPLRDYKIKDKFKRTLTLDTQVNNTVVVKQTDASSASVNNSNPQQVEPVKLVISKKKGSIFKSRVPSEQTEQVGKRHLYKHRWEASANGDANSEENATTPTASKPPEVKNTNATVEAIFNDFNSDETRSSPVPPIKMTRVIKPNPQAITTLNTGMDDPSTDTITSVKIDRKAKEYYTVVRNVKTAHQIQEIGEYQEMDDDVEYILDALQPHNPLSTRCLSALQLATKCMVPAFRMHVRAHGVVTKFFKALSDASRDLSLGLCTTAIMYILSQEGLNMDLDRDSLELMMLLLESEQTVAAPADHANYERNKQRVRELCEELKGQGKGTHLNVDSITVGTLAMETLLSLTSKRAGEWFKEELRELGGLEHIIKTINDCCRPVIDNVYSETGINWTRPLLDNMQTVERCLRVLENVTQLNEENQKYILTYNNGSAATTLCSLYSLCNRELIMYPTSEFTSRDNPGIVIRELLIPLMKVLISLTHSFSPTSTMGAELVGRKPDVIDTSFHLLLKAPNYIPERCVFELSILSLSLLNNLTMHTQENRDRVMKAYAPSDFGLGHHDLMQHRESAISAVMAYFYKCEELARLVEKNTDAFLDKQDKNKKKQEEVDETVNNLLQKAGHHMEHSLKGTYTAILIGHLITDNEEYEAIVRSHVHGNGFKEIIGVLEKYYNFMNLTASAEASIVAHIKSTHKLLEYFKKRDYIMQEMNQEDGVPLNLETHHHHHDQDYEHANTSANCSSATTTSTQRVYKTYSQR
ncbi:protein wings apart-like isoform X1 [Musca domestica]|uniref:Protein wings apart-like isoform X1 n=1 Tax=Musca domestica TaxID=7370 RepID=A0A9J7CSB2_MUSDO|nr:protein wings apart-like isoform X1 [Musca domestica]